MVSVSDVIVNPNMRAQLGKNMYMDVCTYSIAYVYNGMNSGRPFFCAGIVLESHSLGIGRPITVKIEYMALGKPMRSPWQSNALQSDQKAAQGTRKGLQSDFKETKRSSKDTQRKAPSYQIYTPERNICKYPIHRHTAAG